MTNIRKKGLKKSNTPRNEAVDSRFLPVVKAFGKKPGVTAGWMMSSYGLKVKGKIFAMFGRDRFVVKLPKGQVDKIVSEGWGERFEPGPSRVMKEWAVVKEGKRDWVELAGEAYEFVKSGGK